MEEYLTQWPELSQSSDALLELLLAECLSRASFGVPATQPELQSRFPELAARINLDQVAALAQSEKAQASTDQKYDSPTLLKANEPAVASLPDTEDWSVVRSSRRVGKLTGKRLGRYELRRVLGNGGMGTVYEAWDTELTRAVALTMPRPELLSDPTVLQRFMTEARSAAAIRHPNVCSTYDVGQIDGQYFLTMPLIDGVSLAAWLEQHATTATEAAQIVRKLASALQAVHDLGTRHRDIKASNVMIDRKEEPILMDFGLARLNDSATHVTDTGSMLGIPAYMAPEQIEEGAAAGDHRADIYSLGVLFYQMLTGRLPFVGPVTKVLVQIATQTPPSIASLCPDIDSSLAEICHRAMARDPSSRYQSVADLETALSEWLGQRSRHAPRL